MRRSFRVFASPRDLQILFEAFQRNFDVYYVPTYSDNEPVQINDLTTIPNFGINTRGVKIGNNHFLIFNKDSECKWTSFLYPGGEKDVIRYTSLCEENTENISVDVGGVHEYRNLFPTEISTINYENDVSKALFNAMRRTVKKYTVTTKNGYFICRNAYQKRDRYRFCTINAAASREHDLVFDDIE